MKLRDGLVVVWLATLGAPLVFADGGGGGGGGDGSDIRRAASDVDKAVLAIKAERYPEAIALLESHLALNRDDADGHNWLGYAYRKTGRLEPAFSAYKRALEIDPKHRGAHEYLGEAYLMAGQPEQAAVQLRALDKLCPWSCEQYRDLKRAIAAYSAGRPTAAVSR